MPHFKTILLRNGNDAGNLQQLKVKISVNAQGEFYCHVPGIYSDPALAAYKIKNKVPKENKTSYDKTFTPGSNDLFSMKATTYDSLLEQLNAMLALSNQCTSSKSLVIHYSIESRAVFAADSEGNVYPNAVGANGASWERGSGGNRDAYEKDSHAYFKSGYYLKIGAMVMIKTTYNFDDVEKIKHSWFSFNNDNDQFNVGEAAKLLNSWNRLNVEKGYKEIPYSDKAALFFHNLLLGMAKLSKMIQESTFDQKDLLELIETQKPIALLEAPNIIKKGGATMK